MRVEHEFHAVSSVLCVHLAYYKSAQVNMPPVLWGVSCSMLCLFPVEMLASLGSTIYLSQWVWAVLASSPQLWLQCLGRSCLSLQVLGSPSRKCEHIQETHWPCIPCGSSPEILTTALDLNLFRAFKIELRFNTCFCPFLKCSHHELLN